MKRVLLAAWGDVTHITDPPTMSPDGRPDSRPRARRSPVVATGLAGGVLAAGLGLAVFAVLVLLLWITAPFPDSGLDGALHVAADLWLLAHGTELLRTHTLSGVPAPVGVTPLLITVLPLWLVNRAAVHAVAPPEDDEDEQDEQEYGDPGDDGPSRAPTRGPDDVGAARREASSAKDAGGAGALSGRRPARSEPSRTESSRMESSRMESSRMESSRGEPARMEPARAAAVAVLLTTGYLLVGAGAVLFTSDGPLRSDPWSALLHLPVVTLLAAGAGAWSGCGRPRPVLSGSLRSRLVALRVSLPAGGAAAAFRAALAATTVLVGGGALLGAISLIWRAPATGRAFEQLSVPVAGQCAVLALSVALVPNAAVWGAAFALGPGFTAGSGRVVGPAAVHGQAALPDFPLLAALPQAGNGTVLSWSALLVPVLAGLVVARFVSGAADTPAWRPARTATVAVLAALGCGVAVALLSAWAGGPLGSGTLGDFGPVWWAAGAAAFGWTALLGVPGAIVLRWWERRHPATRPARRSLPQRRSAALREAATHAVQGVVPRVRARAAGPAKSPGDAGAADPATPAVVCPTGAAGPAASGPACSAAAPGPDRSAGEAAPVPAPTPWWRRRTSSTAVPGPGSRTHESRRRRTRDRRRDRHRAVGQGEVFGP